VALNFYLLFKFWWLWANMHLKVGCFKQHVSGKKKTSYGDCYKNQLRIFPSTQTIAKLDKPCNHSSQVYFEITTQIF